jgi:hypothetical protein
MSVFVIRRGQTAWSLSGQHTETTVAANRHA